MFSLPFSPSAPCFTSPCSVPRLSRRRRIKIPIETQQGEAIDTTDRIQIFPRITAENVQSISVKNEYDSFEIYRDPNNDFRIKGHEHLSLRTTKVSELISIAGYPPCAQEDRLKRAGV